ncbi:hypothetical protein AGLY_014329 [Aphis glycines]|uniref:Uncharacterized protein n=1 Tax=Aphis glycines TaxID=307491 RepID=A0A6G0T5S2_APHGL|nr:hypothetical protein AGLY_014329 [Aphis glycines]
MILYSTHSICFFRTTCNKRTSCGMVSLSVIDHKHSRFIDLCRLLRQRMQLNRTSFLDIDRHVTHCILVIVVFTRCMSYYSYSRGNKIKDKILKYLFCVTLINLSKSHKLKITYESVNIEILIYLFSKSFNRKYVSFYSLCLLIYYNLFVHNIFVVKCYHKYNLPHNFYYQNLINFGFDFTLTTYEYIHMKKVHEFEIEYILRYIKIFYILMRCSTF